jgi:AcrR family transcriptional regulator
MGTADRILHEATRLFAARGYEGTSVRAISEAAETNVNAVSYHFGGKQALYEAVIARFGGERLEGAKRILGRPPKDFADFESRLVTFADEMVESYLANPEPLIICFNEWQQGFRNCDGKATTETLTEQARVLVDFLRAAQKRRWLRAGLDLDIVAGALLERLTNQVRYADAIAQIYEVSIKDQTYRRHWTEQTVSLLLHGAARPTKE